MPKTQSKRKPCDGTIKSDVPLKKCTRKIASIASQENFICSKDHEINNVLESQELIKNNNNNKIENFKEPLPINQKQNVCTTIKSIKNCSRKFGKDLKNTECAVDPMDPNKSNNERINIPKLKSCTLVTSTPIVVLQHLNINNEKKIQLNLSSVNNFDLNDSQDNQECLSPKIQLDSPEIIEMLSPVLTQQQQYTIDSNLGVKNTNNKQNVLKKEPSSKHKEAKRISDIMQQHMSIIKSTEKNLVKEKKSSEVKRSTRANMDAPEKKKVISEPNNDNSFKLFEMDCTPIDVEPKHTKRKVGMRTKKSEQRTKKSKINFESSADDDKTRQALKAPAQVKKKHKAADDIWTDEVMEKMREMDDIANNYSLIIE